MRLSGAYLADRQAVIPVVEERDVQRRRQAIEERAQRSCAPHRVGVHAKAETVSAARQGPMGGPCGISVGRGRFDFGCLFQALQRLPALRVRSAALSAANSQLEVEAACRVTVRKARVRARARALCCALSALVCECVQALHAVCLVCAQH